MLNKTFDKEFEKDEVRLCTVVHHRPKPGPAGRGAEKDVRRENLRGEDIGREHDGTGGILEGAPVPAGEGRADCGVVGPHRAELR